jgi:immunity protein Imm1 of predicted polymorphic toxin system
MTYVMRDYHGHDEELSDPVQAGEWFDEQTASIMPNGTSGQAIWFGPADSPAVLRIDIDIDAGRAAMRWLPDNSYAIELELADPIIVIESPDSGPLTIAADLARVRPATARRAVIEYVSNGQRPESVSWQTGETSGS